MLKSKIITPNIFNFESSLELMQEFLKLNNQIEDFSYRSFADSINWPNSLIGDLSSGRKILTLRRALEFAEFTNMETLEIERIIYLVNCEASSQRHKDLFFINNKIEKPYASNSTKSFNKFDLSIRTTEEELKIILQKFESLFNWISKSNTKKQSQTTKEYSLDLSLKEK